MNQNIAHSDKITPWDLWIFILSFPINCISGLPYNLDIIGNTLMLLSVRQELFLCHIRNTLFNGDD